MRVNQRQPALVLPEGGRSPFDDVDDQRVGKPPRHPRILDPAELQQPVADCGDVHERLRGPVLARELGGVVKLVGDHPVDGSAVHVVQADDLIAADGEAHLADRRARRPLRLGRDIEREQHDGADCKQEAAEDDARDLVRAPLIDGKPFREPLRDRDFRRLARLRPSAPAPSHMCCAHPNASSIRRSTSSP